MLYSRYLSGDTIQVWKEISQIDLSQHPQTDVLDVCKETVDRCFYNIQILHRRLIDIGYQFENPDTAFVASTNVDLSVIGDFQSKHGELPLVLREWYNRISCVSFAQDFNQLYFQPSNSEAVPDVAGLGVGTVLLCLAPANCVLLLERLKAEALADDSDSSEFEAFYPIGGSSTNCNPKGVGVPCTFADTVIYDDGIGAITFVEDLRSLFQAGGFVFWYRYMTSPRKPLAPVSIHPKYDTVIPYLQHNLKQI
jgi:hypothetical protein